MANIANMKAAGRNVSESRNLMENSDWTNSECSSSDSPQVMPALSMIMTRERQTMLQKTRTNLIIFFHTLHRKTPC